MYRSIFLVAVLASSFITLAQTETTSLPSAPNSPSQNISTLSAGNFFQRIGGACCQVWTSAVPNGTNPKRRGFEPQLDSTLFPSTAYSAGGTPVIVAPDTETYPLMDAVNGNKTRPKIYGCSEHLLSYAH